MVVECVNMAASNTVSTVDAHAIRRRGGGSQSGFHAQQQQQQLDEDLVRLHSGSRDQQQREHTQFMGEFMSAKDVCRRKKVNRTAKLKQCKLDVRREQWLSQRSQGKQGRAEPQHHHEPGEVDCAGQESIGTSGQSRSQAFGSGVTTNDHIPASSPPTKSQSVVNDSDGEHKHTKKEVSRSEHGESCPMYFESGELHGGNEKKQGSVDGWCCDESKSRSNSSCTSSSYTGSGSDDNEDTHDAEDDWEAAFDALHVQGVEGHHKGPSSDRIQRSELKDSHERKPNGVHHLDLQSAQLKPEYRYKNNGFGGRRGNSGRAWRPDDISRPPVLPRLARQHTHPSQQNRQTNHGWGSIHGNVWGPPASPSYCPICTEELDMTDSSYIPCNCGFQLCLFCYHRIASDDGRCPGCRKAYSSEGAVKLSHSSSVWLHV
jgi:hypothetical protein